MLAALLMGTAGIGVQASAASNDDGAVGVRLLEAPVNRHDAPRARTYIVDHLPPGATITRRMAVSSTSATAQQVGLYAGAATIVDHAFTFARDRKPNELTTWTSLDISHVDLPPQGDATAQVDIGPGGESASDFQVDNLTPARDADGRPRVTAQVHNTGGRALDMGGKLSLSGGPSALTAGPFPVVVGTTLAPGDTAQVTVLLDERLPDGPWTVDMTLVSGLLERTVSGTLTFPPPDHVGEAVKPYNSAVWPRHLSAEVGLALIPVAGLSVWYLRRRARRRI